MPRLVLTGFLLLLAPAVCGAADISVRSGEANAIGVAIGAPQTVAVTYWRALGPDIQLGLHAGSLLLFSSAGARVQVGSMKKGLHPYAFAGYAAIYSTGGDCGDPSGTSGYLWLGPGLNMGAGCWTLFAEICALLGGDPDHGLGVKTWIVPFDPAVSGGLLFRF